MGTIIHKAVIVTLRDPGYVPRPDVDALRAEMPEELRGLLVGPVPGLVNGFVSYFWAPSGSKLGWPEDVRADEWCERFIALWSWRDNYGYNPYDVLVIRYGEDQAADGMGARVHEPYAWRVQGKG